MAGIDFKAISSALSCEDFARSEMQMRGKRINCPIHHGDSYSMALLPNGRAHCHQCGRTVDTVQLAAAVWGMGQLQAARQLNTMFHLGIADSMPTEERRTALSAKEQERQTARNNLTEAMQALRDAIDDAEQQPADSAAWRDAMRRVKAEGEWWRLKYLELLALEGATA